MRKTICKQIRSSFFSIFTTENMKNMKKFVYYIFIVISITLFFVCCSDDENSSLLRTRERDLSDLEIYIGSPSGGYSIDLATAYNRPNHEVKDVDSLRTVILRRYFLADYNAFNSYYSRITFEFNGDKLTYINYNGQDGQQVVSGYFFANSDSLFIEVKDKDPMFLATGNEKELRKTVGFIRYPDQPASVELYRDTANIVDIEKALSLSYLTGLSAMTNPEDTIIFCNVGYIFK